MSTDADASYALEDASEIERRRAMLKLSHMTPLVAYAERIRHERGPGCVMPLFDPCDGGVNAKILFLLEAPGPKAARSSFISRNNPDEMAKNMNSLLSEAGLPRDICLLWNIVPWYIGDGRRIRAARKSDIEDAAPYLRDLLSLLTSLRAIVLVGKPAASAATVIGKLTKVPLYFAPHPSPKVFNVYPAKKSEALNVFRSPREYVQPQV